jgi:hypothetical protein
VRIFSGINSQVKWLSCRRVPYSQAKTAPDTVFVADYTPVAYVATAALPSTPRAR